LLDGLEVAAGVVLVLLVLYDLFQSVVLPRPAVGRVRFGPLLQPQLWRLWRWVGTRAIQPPIRESMLAAFGPLMVLMSLVLWVGLLVVGYGLVLYGLRTQIHPHLAGLGSAFYFSGASLLTVGYGDIAPVGPVTRVLVVVEAANGLGVVALVISLLFSLYGSFQRREVLVITLDAIAGAPPSGLQLLENCARLGTRKQLERVFGDWTQWSAEVLESHLAYPVLTYFRSSHDNEAWLNSFGAVMDAAVLVATTVEDGSDGAAHVLLKVGNHLMEDFNWHFRFPHIHQAGIDHAEFMEARRRLAAAGYRLREADLAWREFGQLRSRYAGPLSGLVSWLAITPAPWIGDRSYLPHLERPPHPHPQPPDGAPP
jgi:hypothetical protein